MTKPIFELMVTKVTLPNEDERVKDSLKNQEKRKKIAKDTTPLKQPTSPEILTYTLTPRMTNGIVTQTTPLNGTQIDRALEIINEEMLKPIKNEETSDPEHSKYSRLGKINVERKGNQIILKKLLPPEGQPPDRGWFGLGEAWHRAKRRSLRRDPLDKYDPLKTHEVIPGTMEQFLDGPPVKKIKDPVLAIPAQDALFVLVDDIRAALYREFSRKSYRLNSNPPGHTVELYTYPGDTGMVVEVTSESKKMQEPLERAVRGPLHDLLVQNFPEERIATSIKHDHGYTLKFTIPYPDGTNLSGDIYPGHVKTVNEMSEKLVTVIKGFVKATTVPIGTQTVEMEVDGDIDSVIARGVKPDDPAPIDKESFADVLRTDLETYFREENRKTRDSRMPNAIIAVQHTMQLIQPTLDRAFAPAPTSAKDNFQTPDGAKALTRFSKRLDDIPELTTLLKERIREIINHALHGRDDHHR